MAATVACPHCQAILEQPNPSPHVPVQCPQCLQSFYLPGMAPGVETSIRSGPPPAVTFTADPTILKKAHEEVPILDWKFFPGAVLYPEEPTREHRPIVPHRGYSNVLLGVLALNPCLPFSIFFGVLAINRGDHDIREINFGHMDPGGENLTKWGRIFGYVGIFFWTVIYLLFCITTPNRFR